MADTVAATTTVSDLRRFRMGKVLALSFTIFFRNILWFSLIALTVWVPLGVSIGIAALIGITEPQWVYRLRGIDPVVVMRILGGTIAGTAFLTVLLYPVSAAVILHATFQHMRDGRARIGASIKLGFARAFWVILVALVGAIALAASAFVVATPLSLIFRNPSSMWPISLVLAILPFTLAVIWSVAIPACVVERLGPIKSLGRSRRLTKDYRWPIAGILLLIRTLLGTLSTFIIGYLVMQQSAWNGLMLVAFLAVLSAFAFVVTAVIYHELRLVKEGVEIQQIASVFD